MPDRIRQQLGVELRAMRTLAGLSQRDMQAAVKLSQVVVSRVERGEQLLPRAQVEAWVNHFHPSPEVVERVAALTEAAHGETRAWEALAGSHGHVQGVAADREERAVRIRECSPLWIPGLCQTAEYARTFLPQVDPSPDHAGAVASRIERQQILYAEGRTFQFVIGESALRWEPGPNVLPGQRDKLATIATLSDVEVRVLRLDRIGTPEWQGFTLYDTSPATYVTAEYIHGGIEQDDPKVVDQFEMHWSRLWEAAARGDDAVALIRDA